MELTDRFLKYISFDTQSSEENEAQRPSTQKQFELARYLKRELESLGLQDVEMDEHAYVYATLPANTKKPIPTIGFIAHMDTSPDCSGENVKPRIIKPELPERIRLVKSSQILLINIRDPLLVHLLLKLRLVKCIYLYGTHPLFKLNKLGFYITVYRCSIELI